MLKHLTLAVAITLMSSRAEAQTQTRPLSQPMLREATIVRVDESGIVVDAGSVMGVENGVAYIVYRPISVRHPLTGRTLRDRFPIGNIVVRHAGQSLSLAHPEGTLTRPPLVGDVLVPVRAVPIPVLQYVPSVSRPDMAQQTHVDPLPSAAAQSGVSPVNSEERELFETFTSTLGREIFERIRIYESFLRAHPNSAYRDAIQAELNGWIVRAQTTQDSRNIAVSSDIVTSIRVGEAGVIALQVAPETTLTDGAIYVRRTEAVAYERITARIEGDGFLRAQVPESLLTVGTLEYFAEVTDATGQSQAILGRANAPLTLTIERQPVTLDDPSGRTRIDLRAEYADVGSRTINGVFRTQSFSALEGDFLQRVRAGSLYGYRVGFGVYNGEAVPLSNLTSMAPTRTTRVVYGYHELEFAASSFVHLIGRLQVGVHDGGLVLGVQGRVRIGNERRTNVVLGGEALGQVGQRAFFALNFSPHERVPMLTQGEVFNQSTASDDPMFRFITQVGYRFAPWFTMSARGSYQLRNIENGGFGLGLNTTFDW
jgi:hypothetical protein